jgi:hypothetical protein
MAADIRRVARELTALLGQDMQALRAKYRELFGVDSTSRDAAFLRRRIAWWIQWEAEDGFSDRLVAPLAEIARAASPCADPLTSPPCSRARSSTAPLSLRETSPPKPRRP